MSQLSLFSPSSLLHKSFKSSLWSKIVGGTHLGQHCGIVSTGSLGLCKGNGDERVRKGEGR